MKLSQKPIRVMLVDDHPTILWGLTNLIESERPRMELVGTANSCEAALAQVRKAAPDIILLDLDLQGKCAVDVLPELLSSPGSRALILTGTRDLAILDAAVQQGARGVLQKDASAEQILKAIVKIHEGELWLDRETMGRLFNDFMTSPQSRKIDPELTRQAALTAKERTIISAIMVETGATNKMIADQLFISEHTLRNHLSSIYQKLAVSNRLALYVYAAKHQMGNATPARERLLPGDHSSHG